MSHITLHPEHGLNPSLSTCFYCGKDKNELLLLGNNKGEKAPRKAVYSIEPCDKCKDYMKQGVIFISVRDGEHGDNPYRTGKISVVKEEGVKRIINPESLVKDILKRRSCFIEDTVWKQIGLP